MITYNPYISGRATSWVRSGPTSSSYFNLRLCLVPPSPKPPSFEESLIRTPPFSFEAALGTTFALSLLCSTRWNHVRYHCFFGIPSFPWGADSLFEALTPLSLDSSLSLDVSRLLAYLQSTPWHSRPIVLHHDHDIFIAHLSSWDQWICKLSRVRLHNQKYIGCIASNLCPWRTQETFSL